MEIYAPTSRLVVSPRHVIHPQPYNHIRSLRSYNTIHNFTLHSSPHEFVKMPSKPLLLNASRLGMRQLRSPLTRRNLLQLRLSSSESTPGMTKLVGPMDNAFNRERLAVREHAAKSSGTF